MHLNLKQLMQIFLLIRVAKVIEQDASDDILMHAVKITDGLL